jgi:hypothetical protein
MLGENFEIRKYSLLVDFCVLMGLYIIMAAIGIFVYSFNILFKFSCFVKAKNIRISVSRCKDVE